MTKGHEDFGPVVVRGLTVKRRIEVGELVLENAEATTGGMVAARRVRRAVDCMLDHLLRTGQLGAGDTAKRRHEAGMWLRVLYHEKAMLGPRSTQRYGAGAGGKQELDDATAWNRRCFNDVARELPMYAAVLIAVCCHDEPRTLSICRALDALADHRGM